MWVCAPARYGGFFKNAPAPTLKLRSNDFFNAIRQELSNSSEALADILVHCAGVLVSRDLAASSPVELVQSLFDLTPAEARVARGLASGKTVENIATDGGTSANTIRTDVRGVLEKTGCNRQAEVVALLTGIASPRLSGSI